MLRMWASKCLQLIDEIKYKEKTVHILFLLIKII